MATLLTIDPGDRPFFELISRIAFCNPFSDERAEFDARIVGHPVDMMAETHLDEMTGIISGQVEKLETKGAADVRKYSVRDRELMQTVFLFEIFHKFWHELDALIVEQVKL